jgi:hypothetical protein
MFASGDYGVGTLMTMNGKINTAKYIEILEDNLWPVIVRHYPEENYIFEDGMVCQMSMISHSMSVTL